MSMLRSRGCLGTRPLQRAAEEKKVTGCRAGYIAAGRCLLGVRVQPGAEGGEDY
jgi:hypothetical protein